MKRFTSYFRDVGIALLVTLLTCSIGMSTPASASARFATILSQKVCQLPAWMSAVMPSIASTSDAVVTVQPSLQATFNSIYKCNILTVGADDASYKRSARRVTSIAIYMNTWSAPISHPLLI